MQYTKLTVAGCAALMFGLLACSGEDGRDGVNGVNGLNGADGTSCSVKSLGDASGYKILCGGDSVGVLLNGKTGATGKQGVAGPQGKDGAVGKTGAQGEKGDKGDGCSVAALSDNSGYDVYCGANKVGTIKNGTNGKDGQSCSTQAADDGIVISCNGQITKIMNGKDGKDGANGTNCSATTITKDGRNGIEMSCDGKVVGTVWDGKDGSNGTDAPATENCTSKDNGDGTYELKCGTADAMKMYKAVCGVDPYDPADKFCVLGKIYNKCGTGTEKVAYTVNREYCNNGKVAPLCREIKRNKDGSVFFDNQNNKVMLQGMRATKDDEFCWNGIITPKCGGKEYGKQEFCGKAFDGKTDSIYAYCGGGVNLTNLEKAYSDAGLSLSSSSVASISSSSSEGMFGNLIAFGGGDEDDVNYTSFYKALADLQNSCLGDVTPLKCGSKSYDGAKQFCDKRDDHLYKYAKILVYSDNPEVDPVPMYWMTENLAFEYKLPKKILESVSGDENQDTTWSLDHLMGKVNYEDKAYENYAATEGRYYTWNSAMGVDDVRNLVGVANLQEKDKKIGACPEGWLLPTKQQLEGIAKNATLAKDGFAGLIAEIILATTPATEDEYVYTDFNVNFLGYYGSNSTEAYFWSSDFVGEDGLEAYGMVIEDKDKATVGTSNRKYAFTVRCVREDDPNPAVP